MHLFATIRSTETTTVQGSGPDAAAARTELEAQVPNGFEVIRVWSPDPKAGAFELIARSSETQELRVEAPSYEAARQQLDGEFDHDAWQLLGVRVGD